MFKLNPKTTKALMNKPNISNPNLCDHEHYFFFRIISKIHRTSVPNNVRMVKGQIVEFHQLSRFNFSRNKPETNAVRPSIVRNPIP